MDNTQELLSRLSRSDRKLSGSQRRIAECIVTHYDKVVFMTAAKLGEYVGVSESTVVRFATALGYDGYPQLRRALQELLHHRLTASQRFEMSGDMAFAQVPANVLKADVRNITETLNELDPAAFEEAVESILGARHIYVMGLRASAPIAEFFAHYLSFIFRNVSVVTSGVSDVFEQLSRIDRGDLLIAISFPRYTARSVDAMAYARKRGAKLIAITDGPLSPLYSAANICLTAHSEMSSFVDSFTAPLSLINALLVALGQRRRTEVAEYLDRMEGIWAEYNVYLARNEEEGTGPDRG